MVLDILSNVQQVGIHLLHPHPYNLKIYGDENVSELADRIKASNWIKPLVITQDNRIISGHSRWQAAILLGYTSVPVEKRIFATEDDELEALLLENQYRDKTPEQRAREGGTWEDLERNKSVQRQSEAAIQTHVKLGYKSPEVLPKNFSEAPKGETRNKVAERVGFGSGLTYQKAAQVVKTADTLKEQGKVEESQALLKVLNTQSVDAAAKVLKMSEQKKTVVLEKIATGEAKTIKEAELKTIKEEIITQTVAAPSKPCVTHASWEAWLPLQREGDLLITDPPYSTDIDDIAAFANSWLPLALSKVKPSGRAYVCIGAYPHELRAYLNVPVPAHLHLLNVLVWTYKNTLGPQPYNSYKLNWQAILYYIGLDAPKLDAPIMTEQFAVQEINSPDGRIGNRYHAWQKPDELAERLIRHSTKPGDTVLDCFAGTGTFLLAAHRLGRVASGCDSSPEMLEIARTRGCEVIHE